MRVPMSSRSLLFSLLFIGFLLGACKGPEEPGGIANPTFAEPVPGLTSVELSWSAVTGATGYTLERQEGSGAFQPVLSDKNQTNYQDTNLKESTNYTYRLKALKGSVSSSGTEKKVTTQSQGTGTKVTALIATWTSKQPVDTFSVATVTNAPSNVTISGDDSISFNGGGEALYYIGGLCNRFTANVSGSGTFKVFADETLVAESTGGAVDKEIVGGNFKQNLSLVFQGTGTATWTNPIIFCQSTPTAPKEVYVKGQWGAPFDWGTGTPATGYQYGYIVPTHAANLPDGTIATWAAWKETTYGNKPEETPQFRNQTAGFVWNPSDGSFLTTNNPTHDMFCAGLSVMSNGDVFVAGGGSLATTTGVDSQHRTSYFNSRTKTWAEVQPVAGKPALGVDHWYGSAVALPDNRVFVVGGAGSADLNTSAETRGPTMTSPWARIPSTQSVEAMYPAETDINIPNGNITVGTTTANRAEWSEVQGWYPYLSVAPDGDLFQSGPLPKYRKYKVGTDGSVTGTGGGNMPAGVAQMRTWGNSIMYDEGKLLVTGGSVVRGAGATNTGILLDINGAVTAEAAPPMRFRRAHQNSVVLPTGDVMIMGGNNSGKQFTDGLGIVNGQSVQFTDPKRQVAEGKTLGQDANANYQWPTDINTESALIPELFSPDKKAWRDLASMSIPRNYHSIGILLQDGRVLAAGGGLCGDLNNNLRAVPCNHPDGQVFEPPYLFRPDGTRIEGAARPAIGSLSVGNVDGYPLISIPGGSGAVFNVTMSGLGEGSQITKFSMIKLSAVTHSINTDVRYVEYSAAKGLSGSGNTYQITTTSNKNVLTPGYYFLFALNDKGVPSVAKVVQVN
jgi:Domain of unknown function (DUF1929)